ncbi:ABC transporter ATP-binding protein [Serinibacter arcticus]|uniref:ABC-type multidrug transport system, ATPase component n=1 Tax=Serinibacter arcticus TaxID=1655435 RepID=A0A4Z1E5Y8_9MICO|nr:ATP-binding cassette domain-containing protein [Serinibacter arcticus]TGO06740.1 ABC-type multidrug transport system, ATPase component [Serinibacter arcticus]
MITTTGLTRTFTKKASVVEAVRGIDLSVADGELVAILGPNGAGKSTTLKMLTGLLAPTFGSATVAGHDVVAHPDRVRQAIGYIGQGNSAGHYFRVADELASQAQFYGVPAAEGRRRASDLLAALDLVGLEKRTVNTLSGGQRRRLDVAMGLLNRPPLLFLDEPSTGMDPASRANLWEHVQRMRHEFGMTLVLTTHYLEEADRMAERVVVIDQGSIIADDTPAALRHTHASDVVTLTWASDDEADRARDLLRRDSRFDGHLVAAGEGRDSGLRLELDDGPAVLPALLHALEGAALRPATASIAEATLDDVFLNLTGRSLREESESGDDAAAVAAMAAAAGGPGGGTGGAA